jgi:hypothetical protein
MPREALVDDRAAERDEDDTGLFTGSGYDRPTAGNPPVRREKRL